MKTIIVYFSRAFWFILLLSACGGGGGDSSATAATTTTQQSTTESSSVVVPASTLSAAATPLPDPNSNTLTFTDASFVSSVTVSCDDRNITTDAKGEFECDVTPMRFYLGNLYLGELNTIPADKLVFPQDIVHVPRAATAYPDVVKISMLLESLDYNNRVSDGIDITAPAVRSWNAKVPEYGTIAEIPLETMSTLLGRVTKTVVSAQAAQINLTRRVAELQTVVPNEQLSVGRVE